MNIHRIFTPTHQSSGHLILWSVVMLNPFLESMARNSIMLYQPMLAIVPYEEFWGALFLTLALTALWCSYKGYFTASSMIIGSTFMSMGMLYFMGDIYSVGGPIYTWIGFFNIFAAVSYTKWFK